MQKENKESWYIMQIRLSKREDAASMIELEHLVWTPGTTPGDIHFDSEAEFLLKSAGSKIVVVTDDKVVGILGYKSPSHSHQINTSQKLISLCIQTINARALVNF